MFVIQWRKLHYDVYDAQNDLIKFAGPVHL